jgi:hypothetical protein
MRQQRVLVHHSVLDQVHAKAPCDFKAFCREIGSLIDAALLIAGTQVRYGKARATPSH